MRSNNSACKASWAFLEDSAAFDFKKALEALDGSVPVLLLALDILDLVRAPVEALPSTPIASFAG